MRSFAITVAAAGIAERPNMLDVLLPIEALALRYFPRVILRVTFTTQPHPA
jgi:hypothetical protein